MFTLKDVMIVLLNNLKTMQGINARYIHCDNASENETFEMPYKQEGMCIRFEYEMPVMHQPNG